MDSLSFKKFEFHHGDNFLAYPSQISDYGSSSASDGDYKLASSNPKKRAGRRKFKETRHPVYRGIRRRNGDKWVCELRRNSKSRLWLGTYPTANMAARAHDVAALALRGKSACLNFADSTWRLPVPVSTSDSDIRKAAVEAAEAFRPQKGGGVEESSEAEWERSCSDVESSGSSTSLESDEKVEEVNGSNEEVVMYLDEEALLFMPQLLDEMADGLLVSPPVACVDNYCDRGFDFDAGISLWNFHI